MPKKTKKKSRALDKIDVAKAMKFVEKTATTVLMPLGEAIAKCDRKGLVKAAKKKGVKLSFTDGPTAAAKPTQEEAQKAILEVDRLATENTKLQLWVADLQAGIYVNCVYCGHRYGPNAFVSSIMDPRSGDKVGKKTMAELLKEHIKVCPKHPLSKAMDALKRISCHLGDDHRMLAAQAIKDIG